MNGTIIVLLIVSVIGTGILMFFTYSFINTFIKFKLTKRKMPIIISVYAIIVIFLLGEIYRDIPFWVWPSCYVITVMLWTLLARFSEFIRDTLFDSPEILKCPHCGAWNEYEKLQYLGHRKYNGWTPVDRAIKDSYGNRVGSYESLERCTHHCDDYILRCTKCGEEFEHTFH